MGCPTNVNLGDNITFTVCTHAADRAECNADADPTYRLYHGSVEEDPLLTGNLTLLDPVNTVGFYGATVACTEGNGFVLNEEYTVRIRAVVDSDPGSISYAFKVVSDAKLDAVYAAVVGGGRSVKTYTTTVDGIRTAGVYCRMTLDTAGLDNVSAGVSDANGLVWFSHSIAEGTTVYIFPLKHGVTFSFDGKPYDTEVI